MALGNMIERFFVYLGFEVGTSELDEWFHKVEEAEAVAAGLGAALVATSGAVFAFVSEISEGVAELKEFADVNNLNIEELQAMGYAASVSGSSLEAVKSSMAGVNQMMGQSLSGIGRGAKFFQRFGLSAKDAQGHIKSVGDMFSEILDKAVKRGQGQDVSMLRRLGIDPSLILLARKGKEGIAELNAEARQYGLYSEEDAEKAVELKEAWTKLHFIGEKLGQEIALKLIPGVLKIVDGVRKWALANREFIETKIIGTLQLINLVVEHLWHWLFEIVSGIASVVRWVLEWKIVSYALVAAFAAIVSYGIIEFLVNFTSKVLKAVTAMLELDAASSALPLLIGLLGFALFLVTDDVLNFLKGNNSVIGQLKKDYPHAFAVAIGGLALLALAFSMAADAMIVSMIRLSAKMLYSLMFIIGRIWAAVVATWNWAAALFAVEWPLILIIGVLALLGFAIYELMKHWQEITDSLKNMWRGVREELEGVLDLLHKMSLKDKLRFGLDVVTMNGGDQAYLSAKYAPKSSSFAQANGAGEGRNANTNSSVFHTTIDAPITIQAAENPNDTGVSVRDHLFDLHRNTTRDAQNPFTH